jgi:hypothetical protein
VTYRKHELSGNRLDLKLAREQVLGIIRHELDVIGAGKALQPDEISELAAQIAQALPVLGVRER